MPRHADALQVASCAFLSAAVAHLRAVAPPPPGARVRVVRDDAAPGEHGHCASRDGRRFTISIYSDLSEVACEQILIHEWAHMLAWHDSPADHGPEWGATYARVYCAYFSAV